MERFAINILHKQIYKICRLCGVDQPSKVPILEETEIEIIVGDEEEATLAKKILDCVGIEVRGPPALIALFFSFDCFLLLFTFNELGANCFGLVFGFFHFRRGVV